ncbi:MAG: 50S ribosomal protein L3 [Candidatus Omnitrophota bacterium]|nr:50S ribosomal protein L3 [Candidatus Omnitrophota bacterium]
MVPGILGKKIGMTQIFSDNGRRIPVTVLKVGPCLVQAIKTVKNAGYTAVQLGYDDTKENRVKKPQRVYLKKNKLAPKKFVKELRCEDVSDLKVGDEITSRIFQKGDFVDITGRSKGKGFQGGMKRCGWSGGQETHGSMSHRAPGSIGASSFPSRVTKGHGMPGHLGNAQTTVQNIVIVDVNTENSTIAVKGAVPGANGIYLTVKYAKKKVLAKRIKEEEPEQDETVTEQTKEKETKDGTSE